MHTCIRRYTQTGLTEVLDQPLGLQLHQMSANVDIPVCLPHLAL